MLQVVVVMLLGSYLKCPTVSHRERQIFESFPHLFTYLAIYSIRPFRWVHPHPESLYPDRIVVSLSYLHMVYQIVPNP